MACCCPEIHSHVWVKREIPGEVWLECRYCGAQDDYVPSCTKIYFHFPHAGCPGVMLEQDGKVAVARGVFYAGDSTPDTQAGQVPNPTAKQGEL